MLLPSQPLPQCPTTPPSSRCGAATDICCCEAKIGAVFADADFADLKG